MSDTVIRVENISKLYRLGEVGTGSLAHDVNRWWHRIRGKEDPYLKIGEVNDRTKAAPSAKKRSLTTEDTESTEGTAGGNQRADSGEFLEGQSQSGLQMDSEKTASIRSANAPSGSKKQSILDSESAKISEICGKKTENSAPSASDWVYALKDVSFEVKRGEVLGIIGRNGAGKSTLLKILSRVTTQTEGRIKVRGRIASLLEVGTGFHPELTGRENIFLNGAILGMRKAEIARKFDEIVEFSGCARYIDTPVKRYSSGMYVRLAFAVAAHLEPEILIVDEVLAVGDAEFQKKCLGKMKDVAGHGRTILFVSHNMTAVAELCSRAIYLKNGRMEMNAGTDEVVSTYLSATMPPLEQERSLRDIERREGVGELIRIQHVKLLGDSARIPFGAPLQVEIQAQALVDLEDVYFGVGVNVPGGARLFTSEAYDQKISSLNQGKRIVSCLTVPYTGLAPGTYTLSLGANVGVHFGADYVTEVLSFEVSAKPEELFYGARPNMGLRLKSLWEHAAI